MSPDDSNDADAASPNASAATGEPIGAPPVETDSLQRRSWPRRALNRLEIDRATFFAMSARYWKLVAGPITVLLIARYFSPEVQGYFYMFNTVLGFQTYFEISIPQAIVMNTSHLWSKLQWSTDGGLTGDAGALARLGSLLRTAAAAFAALAVVSGITLAAVGIWMFSRAESSDQIDWFFPWLGLVGFAVLTFALTPFLSVLEGCHQVRPVYRMHLTREIVGNLVVWGTMAAGANLWVPVFVMAVRLLIEIGLLIGSYRRLFGTLWHAPRTDSLDWRLEVMPFQIRLFLKGVFAFLRSDLMHVLVFNLQGPVVGGQMGLTWTILSSIRNACSSWVRTRVPQLGTLIQKRDWNEADRILFRVGRIAVVVMTALVLAVVAVIVLMNAGALHIADRFLGPAPTFFLAIGLVAALIKEFQWLYLHAHGRSPYLGFSVVGSLVCGVVIVAAVMSHGATGAAVAFALLQAIFLLPLSTWAFGHLRRQWHNDDASAATSVTSTATGV
ncbi:polysaccharide biosynthesis protein [Crateriforma conspicua]|uniref:Polysaccharide biosynthesis protein n=1 Tax=Crateriforma conspicua TaxID=2527996 RepID=A0A5C5Y667_9PLAN|nr:hypothetical protein [Crateriforma conspicua]QDV65032.1 hypothetical protein Mal65_42010 [Crateriforma conspicua]TWT70429.1 hypothetical protein Pan14r_27350 [Crateriforma conspicua]